MYILWFQVIRMCQINTGIISYEIRSKGSTQWNPGCSLIVFAKIANIKQINGYVFCLGFFDFR